MPLLEQDSYSLRNAGNSWSQNTLGDGTLRFEVREGDFFDNPVASAEQQDIALGKNRSEIGSMKHLQEGRTFVMSFDFKVEAGARNTADWLVLAQLHQTEDKDAQGNALDAAASPPLALQLNGEKMVINARTDPNAITTESPPNMTLYSDADDIVRDRWYGMRFEMTFDDAVGGEGRLKVWRDGVQIVDYTGPLGYNDVVGTYMQFGVYRELSSETFAAQFRNVEMTPQDPAPPMNGTSGNDEIHANDIGFWENEVLNGYAGNDTLDGGAGADTMYGGSGNDTYLVNDSGDVTTEVVNGVDQGGADLVQSYVSYTLQTGIEDLSLYGDGNLSGTGNASANALRGTTGKNLLAGLTGDDTLFGYEGNDTLQGGANDDALYGGDDTDSLAGGTGNDMLYGGLGNDTLEGNEGDDRLEGNEGSDRMVGGAGNDLYIVTEAGDTVVELVNGGSDTVRAAVSFNVGLGNEVEVITTSDLSATFAINLTGSDSANEIRGNDGTNTLNGMGGADALYGYAGNDRLYGGAGADTLYGDAGNDTLSGDAGDDVLRGISGNNNMSGGTGADTIYGGSGNDTLSGDDDDDVLWGISGNNNMSGGAGADLLYAGTGASTLSGGDGNDILRGSDNKDTLYGGAGNDTIYSGTGLSDLIDGGTGDDVYYIDSTGVTLSEAAGGGLDTVRTSVSLLLGAAAEVEVIRVADQTTTGALNLRGSDSNNELRGNNGANDLDGGAGDDAMYGYLGDDIYHVDSSNDRVVETAGQGRDTVITSVSFTIGSTQSIEVLRTDNDAATTDLVLGGNGDDNAIRGNAGNNRLTGGDGNDTLTGLGGNDTVYGGAGNDQVVFTMASTAFTATAGASSLLLSSTEGVDFISNDVESFVFTDRTLTYAEAAVLTGGAAPIIGNDLGNNLTGTAAGELIRGLGANDWLTPGGGNDTVDGGDGTDMISFSDQGQPVNVNLRLGTATSGGDSNTLISIESVTGSIYGDVIEGDAGANRLRGLGDYDWFIGSGGNDTIEGGNGRDMVSYVYATSGISVDMSQNRGLSGLAAGDSYDSVERVTGSSYDDVFYGDANENDFRGIAGNDLFYSSTGGRERYYGGAGYDTVTYEQAQAGVIGSLRLGYGSGGDAVRDLYVEIENLTGSQSGDRLSGDAGRNVLQGLGGDDFLFGDGDTDRLYGGAGNDTLDGGTGSDYAYFDGNMSDFTLTKTSATTATVTGGGAAAGQGSDSLVNVEYLVFNDQTIAIWNL